MRKTEKSAGPDFGDLCSRAADFEERKLKIQSSVLGDPKKKINNEQRFSFLELKSLFHLIRNNSGYNAIHPLINL